MRPARRRRVLVLIPARAGSRGLRHKNVRRLRGVPLLVRAVRSALAARLRGVDWHVVVSTDSPSYARLARRAGAEVLALRPKHLATDRASLRAVVRFELGRCEGRLGACDALVLFSATAPLVEAHDLRVALRRFLAHQRPIAAVHRDPISPGLRCQLRAGRLVAATRAPIGRRQKQPEGWVLSGAFYVASPASIRKNGQFVVWGATLAHVLPRSRAVDVDDAFDLALCEFLLAKHRRRRRAAAKFDNPRGRG